MPPAAVFDRLFRIVCMFNQCCRKFIGEICAEGQGTVIRSTEVQNYNSQMLAG